MSNIYFPSYKRYEKVLAYEYLGEGNIIVPKLQEIQYKKRYGNAVISIDDKLDGTVSKKRNAVLDMIQEREEDAYGWIIDDDFKLLKRKKENKKLSGDEAIENLERVYLMAKDMGATYGGFDYSQDCLKLKDQSPFSFTKPIFGMILAKADDGIRYDTRLRINEDVDFWIQKMNQNRRMLRDNQYVNIFHGEDGGSDSVIKYDRKEQRFYARQINKKWGGQFMNWKKTSFQFKIPIKGI